MSEYSWIVCGLAAFDVLVVALLLLLLRSASFLDSQTRLIMGIGLSGFVFHAFLFFEGPILYLQLATLTAIYLALALCQPRRQPVDHSRSHT
jgi:hypothetical protein